MISFERPQQDHNPKEDAQQEKSIETGDDKKSERPADRIVREEAEKLMPEMRRLVTRGLGDLFELLPKGQEVKESDVIDLIEHTELNVMLPGMRKKFAEEATKQKISRIKDKAEFIGRALETEAMKLFISLEAGKEASENILTRLREERESSSTLPKEDQTERDARLTELRKEILGRDQEA